MGKIKDIEGNTYKTVKIGKNLWMAENLKVSHYCNGDVIPLVIDASEWRYLKIGAYCNYDNNEANVETYGKLYNWHAVDDKRGIAPEDWHVPSEDEWQSLVEYLGGPGVAHGKMKEKGTVHWKSPNIDANNKSSFSALPGGYRFYNGDFLHIGIYACFWSSIPRPRIYDPDPYQDARGWELHFKNPWVSRDTWKKECGYSVRCIGD